MGRELVDQIRSGDRRALARAISLVESATSHENTSGGLVGNGFDLPPARHVVGVTGPPGAGKSTLISALVGHYRSAGESVAVLAVDPSSPLTGGALLGDRIRMQDHIGDPEVYVRSMATRGHLGGLAGAAAAALSLMDHAGFDRLIVETVGVGQSEVEVMDIAEVVVLVIGPSWGDQVQADKAGIVEIADIFVVNKADRPGVEEVRRALHEVAGDRPILTTVATTGEGLAELADLIDVAVDGG